MRRSQPRPRVVHDQMGCAASAGAPDPTGDPDFDQAAFFGFEDPKNISCRLGRGARS